MTFPIAPCQPLCSALGLVAAWISFLFSSWSRLLEFFSCAVWVYQVHMQYLGIHNESFSLDFKTCVRHPKLKLELKMLANHKTEKLNWGAGIFNFRIARLKYLWSSEEKVERIRCYRQTWDFDFRLACDAGSISSYWMFPASWRPCHLTIRCFMYFFSSQVFECQLNLAAEHSPPQQMSRKLNMRLISLLVNRAPVVSLQA